MRKFLFLGLLLAIAACSADSESLKLPTGLNFVFDIKRDAALGGKLNFYDGFVNIGRFTFDGDRVQGGDNFFDRNYPNGLQLAFNPNDFSFDLNFDVPQGTYSRIEVDLELLDNPMVDDEITIQLEGVFTNSDGDQIPFILQIEEFEAISLNATDELGNPQIVLLSDQSSTGIIRFNPAHWFAAVELDDLEEADLETIDGVETLLINDDHNEEILEEVEDRIDELLDLIIYQ